MHLEERLGYRIYRRPAPDARDTTAELIHLDDVNASERRLLRERDIRCRKAELTAKARAGQHLAADRVGASEQALGASEVACRKRRAHRGARHALAVERDVGHRFELEPIPAGGLFEQREVALALGAEAEIAADEQPAHAESAHQ